MCNIKLNLGSKSNQINFINDNNAYHVGHNITIIILCTNKYKDAYNYNLTSSLNSSDTSTDTIRYPMISVSSSILYTVKRTKH